MITVSYPDDLNGRPAETLEALTRVVGGLGDLGIRRGQNSAPLTRSGARPAAWPRAMRWQDCARRRAGV